LAYILLRATSSLCRDALDGSPSHGGGDFSVVHAERGEHSVRFDAAPKTSSCSCRSPAYRQRIANPLRTARECRSVSGCALATLRAAETDGSRQRPPGTGKQLLTVFSGPCKFALGLKGVSEAAGGAKTSIPTVVGRRNALGSGFDDFGIERGHYRISPTCHLADFRMSGSRPAVLPWLPPLRVAPMMGEVTREASGRGEAWLLAAP
jgi:hypothetical protein